MRGARVQGQVKTRFLSSHHFSVQKGQTSLITTCSIEPPPTSTQIHHTIYIHRTAKAGLKVVGEVKKVGKSRNFHPKVGKSRNFSDFKVGILLVFL